MKYRKYVISLLTVLIILIVGCRPNETISISEPHLNAFPKKVSVYFVDTITNTDSLLYLLIFYKDPSKNYVDSIKSVMPFFDSNTVTYNDSTSSYGIYYDVVFEPLLSIYYDGSGNLENLVVGPNSCDGYLPGDDYHFTYNVDGSLASFNRRIYSERCGGYYDTARIVYRNDTTQFNSGYWYDCETSDTVIYFNDNLHVSNIPLFYIPRNSYLLGCGGYIFVYGGFINFLKFGSKNMPLIKQVKVTYGNTIADYSYLFNANNDVSQLIVNTTSAVDIFNRRIKYKFEY